jgi:hypothetical protein
MYGRLVVPGIRIVRAAPLLYFKIVKAYAVPEKILEEESTMRKSNDCFNPDTVQKIINRDFEKIKNPKECYNRFMDNNAELILKVEEAMFKHGDRCNAANKYTPENLKDAMQFYNCLLCALQVIS